MFSKSTFSKNSFRNTIRVSNSLDSDQDRHYVAPDLGPNCLQRLSADDKPFAPFLPFCIQTEIFCVYFQERIVRAEANIMNLEIPGELAYVYNKLDGRCFKPQLHIHDFGHCRATTHPDLSSRHE